MSTEFSGQSKIDPDASKALHWIVSQTGELLDEAIKKSGRTPTSFCQFYLKDQSFRDRLLRGGTTIKKLLHAREILKAFIAGSESGIIVLPASTEGDERQ